MAPLLAVLASMVGWQCWGVLFEVVDFLFFSSFEGEEGRQQGQYQEQEQQGWWWMQGQEEEEGEEEEWEDPPEDLEEDEEETIILGPGDVFMPELHDERRRVRREEEGQRTGDDWLGFMSSWWRAPSSRASSPLGQPVESSSVELPSPHHYDGKGSCDTSSDEEEEDEDEERHVRLPSWVTNATGGGSGLSGARRRLAEGTGRRIRRGRAFTHTSIPVTDDDDGGSGAGSRGVSWDRRRRASSVRSAASMA